MSYLYDAMTNPISVAEIKAMRIRLYGGGARQDSDADHQPTSIPQSTTAPSGSGVVMWAVPGSIRSWLAQRLAQR